MRTLAALPFCLLLALAVPAAAQTEQDNSAKPQNDNCRAQTEQGAKQQPSGDTLTETLDDCGGVLKPPPTGDQEMTTPAPAEGKTPVIKPGEVPAQPPAQ